jgi:phage terminase large subunit-like protein
MALLAELMGKPLMPWQRQVVNVAGELLDDGTPAYREVRVTIPRQSGKTLSLLVVELDRSLNWGPQQHTLYAAQDRNNSRAKWEEQSEMLQVTPLRRVFKVRARNGSEQWRFPKTGSTVGITASGESSGHGQTLDLGIIDEAFAQRDERLAQAFRPAMMTRENAQMWVVSTMGTDESFFLHDRVDDGRARVEAGERQGVAYFEWSAGDDDDPDNPETWWRCMPALGHTVTEKVIRADHDAMEPGEFARAYLNRRASGGRPVIDPISWAGCRDSRSQLAGLPCFSVDVTPDRSAASIGVAGWRPDGRRHLEVVDHRPNTDWLVERLHALQRRWQPWPVIVDPGGPAGALLVDLAAAGVTTETVSTREYAHACGQLFDAVVEGAVRHLEQPVLNLAVFAARKRPMGDAWAWARKTGGDISPLVAVTLAHYGLVKSGTGSIQIL